MRTSEIQYPLPEEAIAQSPAPRRDAARLLHLSRDGGPIGHGIFRDLPGRLRPGDLLVVNDTRVRPARMVGHREATGGRVEALLVRKNGEAWIALGRTRGKIRGGERIRFGPLRATFAGRTGGGEWRLRIRASDDEIEAAGLVPLPPYIRRPSGPQPADRLRYQTVYADRPGSVAAPTAGLHFTHGLLERLEAMGVEIRRLTLHVGPGTFRPIRTDRIADHRMEAEPYAIPPGTRDAVQRARSEGRRVVAVGTTVTRSLETWVRTGRAAGETDLFIHPPFRFGAIDGLLTNFHLPGSTLICLVAAFAGTDRVLDAYREAAASGYRFTSFGDAMLVL